MLTFNDLIKNNVAPSPYKVNVVDSTDRICINYNNIWGVLTDTHMSKGEDGKYYITGSILKDRRLAENLVMYCNWGNYYFRDSSVGAYCLLDFAHKNHLVISHSIINGDDVLELKPMTDDEIKWYEDRTKDKDACGCYCNPCYVDKPTEKDKDMSYILFFKY